MKVLNQFLIILGISFVGELCNLLLPFPVPASVYGLLILFVCLCMKWISLEKVETAAEFFLNIMPVLFIASAVSLMTIIGDMLSVLVAILCITVISTIVVMIVTGMVAQQIIKRKENKEELSNVVK